MDAMANAVRRANVVYDLDSFQSGWPHVPPFISSGILGGCFDFYGFMDRPNTGTPEGRTVLGYTDHYFRAEHGRHIQLTLAAIQAHCADGTPLNLVDCTALRQELDLLTGTLTTSFDLYGPATVAAFASQAAPNLLAMQVERRAREPGKELVVRIECDPLPFHNLDCRWQAGPVDVRFELDGDRVRVRSRTNAVETTWTVACEGGTLSTEGTAIVFRPAGAGKLKVFVQREGCPGEELLERPFGALHEEHAAEWRRFWEECWADFPEERAQKVWTRTNYYLASNFPTTPARPMCPTGVLSNIWGFYFPQDVYYVAENVPRLGHLTRARNALQYWLDHLPDVQEYCERIMGVKSAYYPWTPPYRDWADYERDGVTAADSYELHNSAYVVAMIWHYYLLTMDRGFLSEFLPVLEEVFRFYRNISSKNDTGAYDIYHEHARGQDEHSSTAGRLKNLLCAGYSAEYCARVLAEAAEIAGEADAALVAEARDVAACGYDRSRLLRPEGFYTTYEGDDRPPGSQKHPPQLNPIAFLPMPDMAESGSPVVAAWRRRYDITDRARRPHTCGWTYGEFFLSSVRMHAPEEAEKDLRAVQPCRAADPRWIQFYESSFIEGWHLRKAYYFTMSGLYLQGFTDTLMQDWRGRLELFPCLLPGWEGKEFSFAGFRARGGLRVSGQWQAGEFRVTIKPAGAASVKLSVSRPGVEVRASGQATGPGRFAGGEVVEFDFNGDAPIVLTRHAGAAHT